MRDWKDRKLIAKAAKHKNITPKRQFFKKTEKLGKIRFYTAHVTNIQGQETQVKMSGNI